MNDTRLQLRVVIALSYHYNANNLLAKIADSDKPAGDTTYERIYQDIIRNAKSFDTSRQTLLRGIDETSVDNVLPKYASWLLDEWKSNKSLEDKIRRYAAGLEKFKDVN